MMRIILFGPPGCGKGTQADLIEKEFGYIKISTGDIIREEIKNKTKIGEKVKAIIDAGELVSDDIIIEMVKNRLKKGDIKKGYIMDGFPRTIIQAERLSEIYVDEEIAIFLNVEEEKIIDRLCNRLTCKKCGAIYNLKVNPPKEEGICDKCGGELYKRSDDNEETIKNRLKIYFESTMPVINYYKAKGILKEIDGFGDIEVVYERIRGLLK